MADRVSPSGNEPPPRPRWVKVLGIVVAAVAVLLVAIAILGGGEHGPNMHLPGGDHGAHTPPTQHGS